MKKLLLMCALYASALCAYASTDASAFKNISDSDKPWCYWLWINGNIDKPTITRDLEEMKALGFGGFLLVDPRGYWEDDNHLIYPKPACEFMDEKWREYLKFAVEESARLGLQVSINLSNCAGSLKGPWTLGADAPKKLICKISPLKAGETPDLHLGDSSRKYFWKVANCAVKYSGAKMEETSWMNAGDGLYSMSSASWGKRTDEDKLENRDALEVVNLDTPEASNWRAPTEGNWVLINFGCTTLDGYEYDVDILDAGAVKRHYKRLADAFKEDFGRHLGTTVTHFYNVSWEGSMPTWNLGFENMFKEFYGYEISSMMPILAGFNMDREAKMQKFITDFRRARNMCFMRNFYAQMIELSHADGVKWHSESGGPWRRNPQVFGEADQLAFLGVNDMPHGEFWSKTQRDTYLVSPIANAAHIYGKNLVAVESFTHMQYHWSMTPAHLKHFIDKMFIDGGNFMFWHTFTASPEKFGKPGIEYFAGTHINGNVTWQKQIKPFLTYIARCQHMLRLGFPSVDFAVYTGDMPYRHWGHWDDKPFADSLLKLPQGCTYDVLNNDILKNSAYADNSKLKLKSGMEYRALIIDLENPLVSPDVLAKILGLQKAGVSVIAVGKKPQGAASLGENSEESVKLGEEIWKNSESFDDYLKRTDYKPDFQGPFNAIHRKLDDAELYFVAGSGAGEEIFRAMGEAELWNPIDGSVNRAEFKKLPDGRSAMSFNLPKNGAMFVLFKTKSAAPYLKETPIVKRIALEGPWELYFKEGRGAPKNAVMQKLIPWNESEAECIRHFSGEAVYSKTFDLHSVPKGGANISLGKVEGIADVYLNGEFCQTVWTDPWKADISELLKTGKNMLEIKVVNTWVNRLIGDAALPPEKRFTQSNMHLKKGARVKETPYSGFCSEDPLQPSGLIGPVVIELK